MTHTLSVLVENKPGALARISGLFARRGFNIESLAVGATDDPSIARMTIVVSVEGKPLEQITKQLHKLVNILRIVELPRGDAVERELMLVKVRAEAGRRAEILEVVEIFRAKVVDVDPGSIVIEATGPPEKVAALEELVRPYGIIEIARTGRVALARGEEGLRAPVVRPIALVAEAERGAATWG